MVSSNDFDTVQNIATLLIGVWAVVGVYVVRYRRRHRSIQIEGTSVLIEYYTDGVELIPLRKGVFGDMHFAAIAATPRLADPALGQAALLFVVELPFASSVHLLGIPKQAGAVQLDPSGRGSIMERVELEGDYDKYFSLYAEKEQQLDSRYVLDPKAMAFTIDFCQSHNWEIADSTLYFVQTSPNVAGDPTSMSQDIVAFVEQIRPAVAVPLTDQQLQQRTPYQEERRTDLLCPICKQTLSNKNDYLLCPNGDGVLLKGAALVRLQNGELKMPFQNSKPMTGRKTSIVCPSCSNAMERTSYNGSSTTIDTCNHCPYRWLDAGELVK